MPTKPKANVSRLEIMSFLFVIVAGVAFHFLYSSTKLTILGLIAPVNESVWEHLKIVFYPMLLFSAYEAFKGVKQNLIIAKAVSLSVSCLSVVVLSFFYSHSLFLDISNFVISVALGQYVSYLILTSTKIPEKYDLIGQIVIISWIVILTIFTFSPPEYSIFQDSITGQYGI